MKRDMDIVRRIVLATADQPGEEPLARLDGVPADVFAAHAQWLHEAGLLHASLQGPGGPKLTKVAIIWRLSWEGCEFADSIRSDTLWQKAKDQVLKPSASWTFGVLRDWLKAEIARRVGIGLS